MTEHTHPDPTRLTIGCPACVRRAYPAAAEAVTDLERTIRRIHIRNAIAATAPETP